MVNVTCAIIYFGEEILITQRSKEMTMPLKWEFPGGKVEANETEEEGIIREIKEEINIDIKLIKKLNSFIHDYGSFKIKLIPFIAKYISGEIILSEHANYLITHKNHLIELDWADADLPIVLELLNTTL